MPYLEKSLRRQLTSTIDKARLVAEEGAADAIRRLGVAEDAAPTWLSESDRLLRRTLRAHARSLGDVQVGSTLQGTTHLMETAAFEHWHRMLFGRFLVERGLLVHPTMGVVLERGELAELAAEEGLPDEWALVERIAAPALPAVFKPDDPALKLPLAPEYAKRLRDLVAGLPEAVFAADDSLGWTYQFWRAAEKDRVNKAGGKIGAAELPVVTQLFTEPYIVRFILHNTLGAWHAGRVLKADLVLAQAAADEPTLRAACALPGYEWDALRFVREEGVWRPAAGVFAGWPSSPAELTVLDPCCGSGHFLTEALSALSALRGAHESLAPAEAVAAVLRNNLYGLEIDGRCVQIAAFALALTAWQIGGKTSALPVPNIAWVGASPPLSRTEFVALGNNEEELCRGLGALHDLFGQAPLLGSLLEVTGGDLLDPARVARLEESMAVLVQRMRGAEPERAEGVVAARGMADAAAILARRFVLQVTNVPFLGQVKQHASLTQFTNKRFPLAKSDLATVMFQRMSALACASGTIALVTPQNWLFLHSYKKLRASLLDALSFDLVVMLGEHGFDSAPGAFTAIVIVENNKPTFNQMIAGIDLTRFDTPVGKASNASMADIQLALQHTTDVDKRINLGSASDLPLLSKYCSSFLGLGTGDGERFIRSHWEPAFPNSSWSWLQSAVDTPQAWGGCSNVVYWDPLEKRVKGLSPAERAQIHNQDQSGQQAWGKCGFAIGLVRTLKPSVYYGSQYEKSMAVLVPREEAHESAIWAYVTSSSFNDDVRHIDKKVIVANATLVKVPFDLAHWQAVAAEKYPSGVPEPYSNDPSQWLFHGHPCHAETGTVLHVALARLSGYRWPAELEPSMRLDSRARERACLAGALPGADLIGLLTLHAYSGQRPLADRLRTLLAAAYGVPLTPKQEAILVRDADIKLDGKEAKDASLEAWLNNRAFRQHCVLFENRPFLWHVWDGLPGGFNVFLLYHRLDAATLQTLTYTVLGDWIARQAAAADTAREEAGRRLQQSLVAIALGDAPLDIFVRWKSLHQQPVGWNPDLDDGVRLNIRPFMTAGVLREQPRGIAWGKDRGTDVASAPWYDLGPQYGEKPGSRLNDHHLTLVEKQAARTQAAAE